MKVDESYILMFDGLLRLSLAGNGILLLGKLEGRRLSLLSMEIGLMGDGRRIFNIGKTQGSGKGGS
jgi:hypothetical protein